MNLRKVLLGIGLAAMCGLSVFAYVAWHASDVMRVEPNEADQAFQLALDRFGPDAVPMVARDTTGSYQHAARSEEVSEERPERLVILTHHSQQGGLVRTEVPFWFLRMKGPALQFVLRGTDFDLRELGITPRDLIDNGPGVVVHEVYGGGDRLLVWLE